MEFKTTTGGTTTLALDPHEEAWLRGVAKATGTRYEVMFARFEQLRRANPLADFDALAGEFEDQYTPQARGLAPSPPRPSGLEDLIELDGMIRQRLKSCGSMQVEAMLLQALATTLQAIAVTQILSDLDE